MQRVRSSQILVLVVISVYIWLNFVDPFQIHPDRIFSPPNLEAWFGTDRLGRDVFARTARALRNTLIDAGIAECAGFGFSLIVSLMAATRHPALLFLNGLLGIVLAALRSVPAFLPALTIAVLLRSSAVGVPLALILVSIIYSIPVYQEEIRRAFESPYVEGTIALGAPPWYTLARCIFPEALPRITRFALLDFASLVAFASLFGAVGLSQPPEPNLGELIFDARAYIIDYWWLFLAPSIVLMITLMTVWSFGRDT